MQPKGKLQIYRGYQWIRTQNTTTALVLGTTLMFPAYILVDTYSDYNNVLDI